LLDVPEFRGYRRLAIKQEPSYVLWTQVKEPSTA
jgi:hypothetical protein